MPKAPTAVSAEAVPTGPSTRRRPGRPRNADIAQQVLEAALHLIDAHKPVTVSSLVIASGVSKAAIYRRWDSADELIAEALDSGRADLIVDPKLPLREGLYEMYFPKDLSVHGVSDARMRQRLILGLGDKKLQRTYWKAHVARRRSVAVKAIETGIQQGSLRAGICPEATIDLLNGVFYYQLVVRGESLATPEVQERCRAGFDVVWVGIQAQ